MEKGLLDLYIQAQPIFRRVMGGWEVGDRGATKDGLIYLCRRDYLNGELEFYCLGDPKLSEISTGDLLISLPPIYDDERPERCLWGMVGWEKTKAIIGNEGGLSLYDLDWTTPTEALLRAILAQKKGEES